MKYRKLSECMTKQEVDILMEVLLPGSKVKDLSRLGDSNCINVTFEYEGEEEILIFYPDDFDNVPEGVILENENFYQIYMIINGYSRMWEEGTDLKIGEWMAAEAGKGLQMRQDEQVQNDTILMELMEKSKEVFQELWKDLETGPDQKKLELYQQLIRQTKERLEHVSYVRGIRDAIMILRTMNQRVSLPDIASDMEELVLNYNNLFGLVETFGDGAKMQLGDYDVSRGIYAIAVALEELNLRLETLFDKVTECNE